MADNNRIGLLYVACRRGRSAKLPPVAELRTYVDSHVQADGMSVFDWSIVSSQKEALRVLRLNPPRLAPVEVDASNRRLDFCAMLHERLPSTKIVALGVAVPIDSPCVDAALGLPLDTMRIANMVLGLLDGAQAGMLHVGPIHLNFDTRTVSTPKGQHHMTPKATALLYYLMTHHNQVLSRKEIMQAVWDTNFVGDTRTLDVHIRWLREYIEEDPSDPKLLTTERGHGYRLRVG